MDRPTCENAANCSDPLIRPCRSYRVEKGCLLLAAQPRKGRFHARHLAFDGGLGLAPVFGQLDEERTFVFGIAATRDKTFALECLERIGDGAV